MHVVQGIRDANGFANVETNCFTFTIC